VKEAQQGHAVALVGSGDPDVCAPTRYAVELAGEDIDVVSVPGVAGGAVA
jgi:cobalt-precorrin 5A hydrolase/precorrin-3B C17-methyltransferase